MAEIIRYVNPDSTAGGDGTTKTTTGANRSYHDFEEAFAAEGKPLSGGADFFTFVRWGTATDFVRLVDTSDWGATSATEYVSSVSDDDVLKKWSTPDGSVQCINNNTVDYWRMAGFDITVTGPASTGIVQTCPGGAASETFYERIWLHDCSGRGFFNSQGVLKMSRSIVIHNAGNAVENGNGSNYCEAWYRTCLCVDNSARGFEYTAPGVAVADLIDMYSGGNGGTSYRGAATFRENCASSDTLGTVGLQNLAAVDQFVDLTPGSEDFKLKPGSDLEDAGVDISTDADYPVSLDFDNNVRSLTTPDIGAYETQAGGPTPIAKALDERWNIVAAIADVLDERWNISASAALTLDERWNLASEVGKALDERWDLGGLVALQLDERWDLESTVVKALDERWDLESAIGKALDERWDVAGAVSAIAKALDERWDVAGATSVVGVQLDERWHVLEALAKALDERWNMESAIGKALDERWNIKSVIALQLDERWDVFSPISSVPKALDERWNMESVSAKALDERWDVCEALAKQLDERWDMESVSPKVLDERWDVAGATSVVAKTLDERWDVAGATSVVGVQLDERWELRNATTVTLDERWKITGLASLRLDERWTIGSDTYASTIAAPVSTENRFAPVGKR